MDETQGTSDIARGSGSAHPLTLFGRRPHHGNSRRHRRLGLMPVVMPEVGGCSTLISYSFLFLFCFLFLFGVPWGGRGGRAGGRAGRGGMVTALSRGYDTRDVDIDRSFKEKTCGCNPADPQTRPWHNPAQHRTRQRTYNTTPSQALDVAKPSSRRQ